MSNNRLVLHAGGWNATEEQVNAVPVPDKTKTYTPVSHGRLIEQLRDLLPHHGMKIERLQMGLAHDGQRLFGVADVVNGTGQPDWGIAVGFRNSYDRSVSLNLCAGSRVFVCDNLAFHGEVMLRERHVGNLDLELPRLVNDLIGGVVEYKRDMTAQVDAMKGAAIDDRYAHDLIIRGMRAGAVPNKLVAAVAQEWHEPKHQEFEPRTAWSLFNAFTEAMKMRPEGQQFTGTLGLNRLFNAEFATN